MGAGSGEIESGRKEGGDREREAETERETERETDRHRQREVETAQTETDRQRQRQREVETASFRRLIYFVLSASRRSVLKQFVTFSRFLGGKCRAGSRCH